MNVNKMSMKIFEAGFTFCYVVVFTILIIFAFAVILLHGIDKRRSKKDRL